MILQSLVSYYEALAAKGEIARPGWGKVRVQYALEIDGEGRLLEILPLESVNERNKPIPRYFVLPAPVKRTVGIRSNFLWDNAEYLLGLDSKDMDKEGKTKEQKGKVSDRFDAAKVLHLSLLQRNDDPFAQAICSFFENWDPNGESASSILQKYHGTFSTGANLTFMLDDKRPDENAALGRIWQAHYNSEEEGQRAGEKMHCLVSGEKVIPELIHPSVKRVKGAQSSGAALVSFNAPAFCSYGREQNANAPVSKYAAFAYTTALNHLLTQTEYVKTIGDMTVVYWAENAEPQYQDGFASFLDGDNIKDNDLNAVMEALSKGQKIDWDGFPIEPENGFCVLGLAPNAARLSVRFFLRSTFGEFAEHLKEHYDRLEIVRPANEKRSTIPLWMLLRETVNPKAKDKTASPQMSGDTLRAILTGSRYPATLFQQIELRIHADHGSHDSDAASKSYHRAAIIKAYLLRNTDAEIRKETLSVKLNETTTYQPYVLGRIFSVLEAIQEKANPGLNTTIKDKYFTSACSTPAVVFPVLLKLAEKHLRKMDEVSRVWFSKQLGQLTAMLTESYPVHLTLYDQGVFQLGYYHQTQKRYEKKNTENTKEDI